MKISNQFQVHQNLPVDKTVLEKTRAQFKEKESSSIQHQKTEVTENKLMSNLEVIAKEVFQEKIITISQSVSKIVDVVLKDRFADKIHYTKLFREMNVAITNFIQQDPILNKQLEATLAKLAKG